MTKILAFTPYSLWNFHTDYEYAISRACQVRGAEVKHLLCDGVFSECDMGNVSKSPAGRPPEVCLQCQRKAHAAASDLGLTADWLSHYLTPDERDAAQAWARGLSPDEFAAACWQGHPVGEWVTSSVVSYYRAYPIRLDDPDVVNVFRGFLQAGAVACVALTRLLESWKPDALLLFNGRMSVLQIALHLARQRGLRVLVHERPLAPGTIFAVENSIAPDPEPFRRLWREWKDVPLDRSQLDLAASWLRDRRFGRKQPGLYLFASSPAGADVLRQRLGAASTQTLVALFTSSTDEYAGTRMLEGGPFRSQEEWIDGIVAWAATRADCFLVIRAHPCLSGKATNISAPTQIDWLEGLAARLPANARMVLPDDPLSSYDLMDCADVGVTYGSTVGLEMLALGKPVVTTPPLASYGEVPGVLQVTEAACLKKTLDRAVVTPPSMEARRGAFRCLYRYFFQFGALPFSLVSMVGLYESEVHYKTPDALRPGRDAGLDRLCDFLLDGRPLFAPPRPDEVSTTRAEEDTFFQDLERQGGGLRPGWKEKSRPYLEMPRRWAVRLAFRAGKMIPPAARRRLWESLPPRLRGAFD